jgi:hypothetical protein
MEFYHYRDIEGIMYTSKTEMYKGFIRDAHDNWNRKKPEETLYFLEQAYPDLRGLSNLIENIRKEERKNNNAT